MFYLFRVGVITAHPGHPPLGAVGEVQSLHGAAPVADRGEACLLVGELQALDLGRSHDGDVAPFPETFGAS